MTFQERLDALLKGRGGDFVNTPRGKLISECVKNREVMVSACGALATWTRVESSGRSPNDTVFVKRPGSEHNIDWSSANCLPTTEETFDMVLEDTLAVYEKAPRLYVTDRLVGADPRCTLHVRTVSDKALTALFTYNMFRPFKKTLLKRSIFRDRPFTLFVAPEHKLDPAKYEGRLRVDPTLGHTSTMYIGMDFDRNMGVVFGSAYCGSVKKMIFTVMNYMLPLEGILPLHCSANEGPDGKSALLLGLSGTGKTTLSADPSRALLGDDEHSWSDKCISNFEFGCYAKLISLNPAKEPDIYKACFHDAPVQKHGAIIENAMIYPDGTFDLNDQRLTENSRGSYPLSFLSNIKEPPISGHPSTILFLTADANGVLPPLAKLTREQAMLWFVMGYTSKLAGTERGIVEPKSTFSRFFGGPFMPLLPDMYARMLGAKMDKHGTKVYLVNTGWSGGPYGVGKRMDINLTRKMVAAALNGALEGAGFSPDPFFKVLVPTSCPGIEDCSVLSPLNTWADKEAYREKAAKLAAEFAAFFEKNYAGKLDECVARECPGR
jgi:phosphoenolpyruvate carboxykinase (ATP)